MRAFAFAAALVAAAALAGCGFHLRGEATYPFTTLYVNSPMSTPFVLELRRTLAASGGAAVVDKVSDAQVILDVPTVSDDKSVLSLSSGGRVREFALTKRVSFRLHDAEGRDWMPADEIIVRRAYTFNESEVLARDAEETRLLKEMQTDAIQQIIRRMQSAKKPA